MLRYLLGLLLLWNTVILWATPQTGDYLIYQGDTLYLETALPLASTPKMQNLAQHLSIEGYNTACWRGYYSIWELQNDSLFWRGASSCNDFNKNNWVLKAYLFAEWINGEIIQPFGQKLHYEHSGLGYYYEFERSYNFLAGRLTNTAVYNNTAFSKSPYYENVDSLYNWLMRNVNWSLLDTFDLETLNHTIVASCTCAAEGKATFQKIYRTHSKAIDKEVIRLIELLPCSVYYRRGQPENRQWSLPFNFARLIRYQEQLSEK